MSLIRSVNTLLGYHITDNNGSVPQVFLTDSESKTMYLGLKGHYGYPDFPQYSNVGGPLYLIGSSILRPQIPVGTVWGGGFYNAHYTGSMMINGNPPTISGSQIYGPNAWGPAAYAKMKPTKPSFNAIQELAELRDLPGLLRQRFLTSGLYAIPNYWLALQFGWKPLLASIRNLCQTQMGAQKRLAQLLRDEGRPIRRRTTMQDLMSDPITTSGTTGSGVWPVFTTNFYSGASTYRQTEYTKDTVWASALFRYWLPGGPRDVNWTRRMKAAIFGLNPSPSQVYRAVPWTWLIDWYAGLGVRLSNMEAGVADRLSNDHFYMMRHVRNVREYYAQTFLHKQNGQVIKVSGTAIGLAYHKVRVPGDPFGFATNPVGLSDMQLSILGAIGLSKLK